MNKPVIIDIFRELSSDLDYNYWIDRAKIFPYIVIIGGGGNGSYITQNIAQMMNIFDMNGFMLLADSDIVESKNLNNQLFIDKDLGEKKAKVLAKRYGSHYKVSIASYDVDYVESVETLESLFSNTEYLDCHSHDTIFFPILVGAVDNNFTRQIMHKYFQQTDRLLYIDVGVEGAKVPSDTRSMDQWTEDERKTYRNSGYTGQVVAGLKIDGETILAPVADVFPEILGDKDSIAPSQLACSNIMSEEPQRLITNKFAAMAVYPYINEIFESGQISNHMTLFHAKRGYMRTTPITMDE
ncbi:ThiF family adenylyltransferase [Desertibacillus haloalkaliphilus]|uniref:ThiF family adenylyltransferase n=1 Tax=Desertibacillus haloalkaliphilus TaxID=1328930 RepID=UPI001C26A855|nr:ThiF family adenylyltransferase [Desertibacillus haloalkaliphilus]MBU8908078.1 ThiF family adenylyltransferase [Desertibacillus haloalkaliphilus]